MRRAVCFPSISQQSFAAEIRAFTRRVSHDIDAEMASTCATVAVGGVALDVPCRRARGRMACVLAVLRLKHLLIVL